MIDHLNNPTFTLFRSIHRGDLVTQGKSDLCSASFIHDAFKNWNNASKSIKDCKSILSAKKEIKKFVKSIPL